MKLKYSLEMVDMGSEVIAVPVGNDANKMRGVLKLNIEGKEILEYLKSDTTMDEIVNSLAVKYQNDRGVLEKYVQKIIEILRKKDLLKG